MRVGEWIPIKGDGTDPIPPLGVPYEARLRDGRLWDGLAVTPFCLKLGNDLFRARGAGDDPVEIRIIGGEA